MKKNLVLRVYWFVFLLSFATYAQPVLFKNYSVQQYTDENGLPQNSIKNIAPDPQGFIWLATEDGLVRFDGRNFYTFNKQNLNVSSNRFFAIIPSLENGKDGKGEPGRHQNSGMYAVADGDEFVKIENGKAIRDSAYVLAGKKNFLYLRDPNQKSFLTSKLPDHILNIAVPNHWIIPDSYGTNSFYLCDTLSVEYYISGKSIYRTAFRRNNGWNYFTVAGLLYYFNKNGTISRIGRRTETLSLAGDIIGHPEYRSGKNNVRIYWNNASGQVYFSLGATVYQLAAIEGGSVKTKLLIENFDLLSRNIQTIHLDKKTRTLFMGSVTNGLFVITNKHFESLTASAESNVFYAQIPYDDNSVLTPTGIVLGKDPVTQKYISKLIPALRQLNTVDERALLRDKNGFVWMKAGQILYQLNAHATKVIRTTKLPEEIKHIYQGGGTQIWLGMADMGLLSLDPSDPNAKPKLIIRNLKITYLAYRTPRQLLLGTTTGLFEYDLDTKKTSLIEGTRNIYIKSIHAARPDQIWLLASDRGLMLLTDNKLTNFPMDSKQYLGSAHCLVDDGIGFFWIPTNKGLFQVPIKDLIAYAQNHTISREDADQEIYYNYFAKDQGFNTNEFNGGCQPCAVKLPNGYISLPSLNGLVWFNPREVNTPGPTGNIILDHVEVNQRRMKLSSDTVILPQKPTQIKFHFSSPCFDNIYNLHLSYALISDKKKVTENDWVTLKGDDINITFAKLDPGNYTLLLRKRTGLSVKNYATTRITVIIPPPWHQTWWAFTLFVIILLTVISFFINWRLTRIRLKNRDLERKIAERTNDLEISKSEVSRQLQMMSRLLTSMTHDIQSPLNYISLTSAFIPQLIVDGEVEKATEIAQIISNSSNGMSNLLKDLLEYIKANLYRQSIKFEDISLKSLIESKLTIFETAIEHKNNAIVNLVGEDLLVRSDYQMLAIVIHNLIDNATKYTENGEIRFFATETTESVDLFISNNGVPLSQGLIQTFNQNFSVDNPNNSGRQAGLGFLIIKEIGVLINVGLSVTQTDLTVFQLRFHKPQ